MSNTKAIFITVRSASTRLPNKAHLTINNKKTIEYVIEQAKKSKFADTIVLCTTLNPEDDSLCRVAENNNIKYFRGSTNDKLDRWLQAAKKNNVDFIVTADGDDLFCSYELMDLAFQQREKNNSDFIQGEGLVSGSFTYGISTKALTKACQIKDTDQTEMMWVYFTETGICKVENLENVPSVYLRDDIRMTLDYEEDFVFFKTVIESLEQNFNTRDVLSFLDKNTETIEINYFLQDAWKHNQQIKTTLELNNE